MSTAFNNAISLRTDNVGVASFNTRTGAVTLAGADITGALGFSPANTVSPTFAGIPSAPTASSGTTTTQIATTAFVAAAVSSSVAGVSSFNTRTGAVTLNASDVTIALSYTPANLISPAFTGTPTAPTAAAGTNTTQLATTAFVTAAVSGSVSGVSSFNTRTGAVTLSQDDVKNAITADSNIVLPFVQSTSWSGAATGDSLVVTRDASYSGGGIDTFGNRCTGHAIVATTTTSATASNCEMAILGSVVSNANIDPAALPAGFSWPQNVGIVGHAFQIGSAPIWAGWLSVQNRSNVPQVAGRGAVVGLEVNVGITGVDNFSSSVGINCVPQAMATGSCNAYTAFMASGSANETWQYGFSAERATIAAFRSTASGQYGMQLAGNTIVGIDLSQGNLSGGTAVRMKRGDAITFNATDDYKMRLNASSGNLEFFKGATRHGYINLDGGADVDLAGGGGSTGVSSFNTRTGAVSLLGSDVASAAAPVVTTHAGPYVFNAGSVTRYTIDASPATTGGYNVGAGEVEVSFDFITSAYFSGNDSWGAHIAVVLRCDTDVIASALRGQGMIIGNVSGNTSGGAQNHPTTQIETWFNGLAAGDNYLPTESSGYPGRPVQDGVQYRAIVSSKVMPDGTSYIRYRFYKWTAVGPLSHWVLDRDTGDVLDNNTYIDKTKSGLVIGHVFNNPGAPAWSVTITNVQTVWRPVLAAAVQESPVWAGYNVTESDGKYGPSTVAASIDSFYSGATGQRGVNLAGSYIVGLDTSLATISGSAIRLAANQYISLNATDDYKFRLNSATGNLEFFKGATRHGYINMNTGADVDLAGGGAAGVSSFNTRTGAVTLNSTDVTSALGYTPVSLSGTNSFSGTNTFTGTTNLAYTVMSNHLNCNSYTVNFASSGNTRPTNEASPTGLQVRIILDMSSFYWITLYN